MFIHLSSSSPRPLAVTLFNRNLTFSFQIFTTTVSPPRSKASPWRKTTAVDCIGFVLIASQLVMKCIVITINLVKKGGWFV